MKRGFALLETIVVITFVTVSLLLLYGTFTSMLDNSRKNILYDDAANIYKMYYLKEYLELNNLRDLEGESIREVTCDNFSFQSCSLIMNTFSIKHLYLVKSGLKDYNQENYSSSLKAYLNSLANSNQYSYYLVGEFLIEEEYHYASIGVVS